MGVSYRPKGFYYMFDVGIKVCRGQNDNVLRLGNIDGQGCKWWLSEFPPSFCSSSMRYGNVTMALGIDSKVSQINWQTSWLPGSISKIRLILLSHSLALTSSILPIRKPETKNMYRLGEVTRPCLFAIMENRHRQGNKPGKLSLDLAWIVGYPSFCLPNCSSLQHWGSEKSSVLR